MKRLTALLFVVMVTLMGCFVIQAKDDECWSGFGKHHYILMKPDEARNFYDANETCHQKNASLASIHSSQNDEFIMKLITPIGLPTWIGLHRIKNEFEWSDGTEVDYFHENYERQNQREACIYVFHEWHEGSCEHSILYFICKKLYDESDACLPDTSTLVPSTTVTNQSETVEEPIETTTLEMTFEEILDEMTIKKKPVYTVKEGNESKTIGAIAILILSFIVFGILLLDLATVRKHLKHMLMINMKDFCNRCVEWYLNRNSKLKVIFIEPPRPPTPNTPSDIVVELDPVSS